MNADQNERAIKLLIGNQLLIGRMLNYLMFGFADSKRMEGDHKVDLIEMRTAMRDMLDNVENLIDLFPGSTDNGT